MVVQERNADLEVPHIAHKESPPPAPPFTVGVPKGHGNVLERDSKTPRPPQKEKLTRPGDQPSRCKL